jgi:hypothetical protein
MAATTSHSAEEVMEVIRLTARTARKIADDIEARDGESDDVAEATASALEVLLDTLEAD